MAGSEDLDNHSFFFVSTLNEAESCSGSFFWVCSFSSPSCSKYIENWRASGIAYISWWTSLSRILSRICNHLNTGYNRVRLKHALIIRDLYGAGTIEKICRKSSINNTMPPPNGKVYRRSLRSVRSTASKLWRWGVTISSQIMRCVPQKSRSSWKFALMSQESLEVTGIGTIRAS